MAQRVPRHSFDLGLLAGVFETGSEIDERFSGFLVVEDEQVRRIDLQRFARGGVDRIDEYLCGRNIRPFERRT